MKSEVDADTSNNGGPTNLTNRERNREIVVGLLTGGGDKPYAFGLATELISKGARLDLIGSDELDCLEFQAKPGVNFLNLRGDQRPDAGLLSKISRVLMFYIRLIYYAATSKPKIFHILWNNKFQFFDRTLLTLYYKLLGKRIVLTVHNVNARKRDSEDTALNRLTLRIQYRFADHIFVHSERMRIELIEEFSVQSSKVSVVPFGINNSVPNTSLTSKQAKNRLEIRENEKTVLFFGNIAPYKGLEYLVTALKQIQDERHDYRLIIAGRPKGPKTYWASIREGIREDLQAGRVLLKPEYIPDEDTEVYFKAADVLVLPYRHIYQSGVLFLAYSFGLPALVSDVGSLRDEIVEGSTGFVFKPEDSADLAKAIETYFASDLYKNLNGRRKRIQDYAKRKHDWSIVGDATIAVYEGLVQKLS